MERQPTLTQLKQQLLASQINVRQVTYLFSCDKQLYRSIGWSVSWLLHTHTQKVAVIAYMHLLTSTSVGDTPVLFLFGLFFAHKLCNAAKLCQAGHRTIPNRIVPQTVVCSAYWQVGIYHLGTQTKCNYADRADIFTQSLIKYLFENIERLQIKYSIFTKF